MPSPERPTFVLSVGSVLYNKYSINSEFIQGLAEILNERIKSVHQKTAIVTGGGFPAKELIRYYRSIGITNQEELDREALPITRSNARLLTRALCEYGVPAEHVKTLLSTFPPGIDVMVTGGVKTGQSSDAVAVDWAVILGLNDIYNIGVPFVYKYRKDGKTPDRRRPIHEIRGQQYLAMIGPYHEAGEDVPLGRVATQITIQNGIGTHQMGPNLTNIENAFDGKHIHETFIYP